MVRLKFLRKLREMCMAKNSPKRGKCARNGNAPSPYTKQKKTPHRYSTQYYNWRSDRLAGRVKTTQKEWKSNDRTGVREMTSYLKEAAE